MPKPRPLGAAADHDARRIWIVAAIRNGVSYDAIARRETISRERVREIVVETKRRNDDFARDLRFLQAARLDPALKLAMKKINSAKLEAIDRIVKVMNGLDKCLAGAGGGPNERDNRERRLRRVETAARKTGVPQIQATPGVNPPAPSRNPLKAKQTARG